MERKRFEYLRAALIGSKRMPSSSVRVAVDRELQQANEVFRVSPLTRRHLLIILHCCRALDTALGEVLKSYGVSVPDSIGPRLKGLSKIPYGNPHITSGELGKFRRDVCGPRNRFLHIANAFPWSNTEADKIINNIGFCFEEIVKR